LTENARRRALRFLGAALISTILVGFSLSRLQFNKGLPLPSLESDDIVIPGAGAGPDIGMAANRLFLIAFLIVLGIGAVLVFIRLARGADWKELWSTFISTFLVGMVFLVIIFLSFVTLPKGEEQLVVEPLPMPTPLQTTPLGPVPPLIIWLIVGGILLATALLGLWLLRSKRRIVPSGWEIEIENARQAILAGDDLKNVILRCYQQMGVALERDQQIERAAGMTTGEFERLLTSNGIPQQPVHQLTQLFDRVRYGHWQPKPGDEEKALACLDAILAFSKEARIAV
jgi:hypothetical protein